MVVKVVVSAKQNSRDALNEDTLWMARKWRLGVWY